jgi:serine/threonine protein kinase
MGGGFSKKKAASGGSRRMLENLPRERKGEAVGEYSVGRVIGLGSMGQIYLVHKKSNGRPYALKVRRPRQLLQLLWSAR